jgi:hypothetical protein
MQKPDREEGRKRQCVGCSAFARAGFCISRGTHWTACTLMSVEDIKKELRKHLLELLKGKFAHIDLESAIKDFPASKINTRIENSPHTAWELLEHIRIAQWDIVEFSRNAAHVSPDWPEGYWPKTEGSAAEWRRSVKQILNDLQTMRDLISDERTDLFTSIPHGDGQTILREALLVADHNSYHLGQIVLLKRILEKE